jgi:uncharacterized damage-inducible protein DinB
VTRIDPQPAADERTTLVEFLEYHRATALTKVAGLTHEQLNRPLLPSGTTMAGLLKHLAGVEEAWFSDRLAGLGEMEPFASAPFDDDPDWEFHSAANDTPDDLVAIYTTACERSRAALARVDDLDALTAKANRAGERFSLRWVLVHMIEETARHNGHLDVLRELTDGATGE